MNEAEAQEGMVLVTVQKRVEWLADGRPFRLVAGEEDAELTTPDGQCLSMPLSAWRGLAAALEKALPKTKGRTKPFPAKPGAPNNGKPWGLELDQELAQLWNKGVTLEETAQNLGRTAGSISSRLIRLGLVENHDEARLRSAGAANLGQANDEVR